MSERASEPSRRRAASRGGYANPGYAASLVHLGSPLLLPRSGGSLLVHRIGDGCDEDATGPYPLFACDRWDGLADDLDELRGRLVAVVLVADPFGDWTPALLDAAFPDLRVAFKEHFVVDLSRPPLLSASRHHRRDAARALRKTAVTLVDDPPSFLDAWAGLYERLVARHRISGPAAFSRESFDRQLRVPGARAFRADRDGELLGAALWFVDGAVAHYHLAAYTDAGYERGVSYGLVAVALERFADDGLEWAALGAGAGSTKQDEDDGLARFKQGWATGTRTAFLCGRVLDERRYAELAGRAPARGSYFPAYRGGARG